MKPACDVLVSGIASADFIFPGLPRLPAFGEEVASRDFLIKPGGAANFAVALQQLGRRVSLVTALGEDPAGLLVRRQLAELGLNLAPVLGGPSVRTPVTAVLSGPRDRAFATYFGQWDHDDLIDTLQGWLPACRLVHASIRDCRDYRIHELARDAGKWLSIDMAWEEDLELADVRPVLAACTVFFTNELEASRLTGCERAEESLDFLTGLTQLAVVKRGAQGCIVGQGQQRWQVPAVPVPEVKDTTGAGDIFCAGFIHGLLAGWPPDECARLATAAGALAVTFYGGVDAAFSLAAVESLQTAGSA